MSDRVKCNFAPGEEITCFIGEDGYHQGLEGVKISPHAIDGRSSVEYTGQGIKLKKRKNVECRIEDDELVCGSGTKGETWEENKRLKRDFKSIACTSNFDTGLTCSIHDEEYNTKRLEYIDINIPGSDISGEGITMNPSEDGGSFRIYFDSDQYE